MIKAVLFDYGGVLSPGGRTLRPLFSKLLDIPEADVEYTDLHEELRRGDISTDDFFIKLGEAHGKNITAEKFLEYSDIFVKSQVVYDLAAQLRKHGIKTGILSNVYKISADILRKDGYYDGFDPVVLSCERGLAKPQPEFYQQAILEVGCKPGEILFIDDQDKCFPPALELGMQVIKAKTEQQIVDDTKALFKEQNGLEL